MKIVGWDIGGAHVKAVLLQNGEVIQVLQQSCPLWKGLDYAAHAIQTMLASFNIQPAEALHAVTMTGELVDLFPNRQTGVQEIAHLSVRLLGEQVRFYAAQYGFVALTELSRHAESVASTNWHASAQCVAQSLSQALFVDIGSTTTDLIRIEHGQITTTAFTDAARLQTGELLYTGVVRTPLMALAKAIEFNQQTQYVAAEYFATTGDVYRLTGDLSEDAFSGVTADGGAKTQDACAVRLARMVGWDAEHASLDTWKALAQTYQHIQLNDITMAINRQLNMMQHGATPIVVAGAGTFLMPLLAAAFTSHPFMAASDLVTSNEPALQNGSGLCFPAYAVAKLQMLKD
jgi:probable H4MPT-linked C1 transfer pathway protein